MTHARGIVAVITIWAFGGAAARNPGRHVATGRIEGVATIASQLVTPRQRIRMYDEPGTPPAKSSPDANRFANVVMYLDAAPALKSVASPPRAVLPALHQVDERFMPHVLTVLAGDTVRFPNDDPIFHNVFSLSRARTFDLGRYPKGASQSVVFPVPGIVQVFCHIHADMSGFVLVRDNQFFTTPDSAGHFSLANVPPGDYRLITWHERIKPMVTNVHVDAGGTTTLTLRIPIPENK